MWDILHWIFVGFTSPTPFMHTVASFVLFCCSFANGSKMSRSDLVPAMSLFCLYMFFYVDPRLEHIAFLPWWVVTLVGLRNKDFLIWSGGLYAGTYLYFLDASSIIAHVGINVSLMFSTRKMSTRARSLVHLLCMTLYRGAHPQRQDVLAGLSAVVSAFIFTPIDWLSLAMVFTSPVALGTFFIHLLELKWYKYYKNNHFQRVKNTSYFIYPLAILWLCLVR